MTWKHPLWANVVAALGVLTIVASIANARLPKDADGSPKRPKSWAMFFWLFFIDLLSWVPQPGKAGLLGKWGNVPGLSSHTMPKRAGLPLPDAKPEKIDVTK